MSEISVLRLLAAAAVLLGGSLFATAGEADEAAEAAARALPAPTLRTIARNRETFLQRMSQQLHRTAPDGVVTQQDLEIAEQRGVAAERSKAIARILKHDLDGDGAVSAKEIEIESAVIGPNDRSALSLTLLEADADKDGDLAFAEILAYASAHAKKRRSNAGSAVPYGPMAFDADGDGSVDIAEVGRVVDAVIRLKLGGAARDTRRRPAANCTLPKTPERTQLVLVSGYEGEALSTVTASGMDAVTSAATLTIQSGDKPLLVVATAYDNIVWKIEGDIDRVWKFAVQASRTGKGSVAGLPKDKVVFLEANQCFEWFDAPNSGKALMAKANVARAAGRDVDHVVATYGIGNLSIPSGRPAPGENDRPYRQPVDIRIGDDAFRLTAKGLALVDPASGAVGEPHRDRTTIRQLMRFYPAGLEHFDPAEVVGPSDVAAYDVLPQQAGLLQLMALGAIRVSDDGYYVVEKPITRFPAGLNGAHSVRFIIRKGVPMPGGSPGHSGVIDEETGECTGPRCG